MVSDELNWSDLVLRLDSTSCEGRLLCWCWARSRVITPEICIRMLLIAIKTHSRSSRKRTLHHQERSHACASPRGEGSVAAHGRSARLCWLRLVGCHALLFLLSGAIHLSYLMMHQNVHEFPGHIACDSASNAEIVVPIIPPSTNVPNWLCSHLHRSVL